MSGTVVRTRQDGGRDPDARHDADGRYDMQQRLGVGASSSVWRARDLWTGRNVCIKRLHPHLVRDEAARSRLKAEVESAGRIAHPHVLPLLDARLTDSEAALVFPYLPGETLATRLAGGQMEPREAAQIAAEIADALAAAHRAGVVHRDVKPSNILLAAEGGARLLDFGISQVVDSAAGEPGSGGMTVGTLPYMAPEQLAGAPPSPANDVYALGALLYEMLSGRPPFTATTPLQLAEAQRLRPADIYGTPRQLARLALAALSYEAGSRSSAEMFAYELRKWLESPASAVREPAANSPTVSVAPVTSARSLSRRKGILAGALSAGLALAVVSAFAFAPDWSASTDQEPLPVPSQGPSPATLEGAVEPKEFAPVAVDKPANRAPRAPSASETRDTPKATKNKPDREAKAKGKSKGKEKGKGKGNGKDKGKKKGEGKGENGKGNGEKGKGKAKGR
ncbi:MAG: protein kinase [Chloroflexota bacterium]|nr:protein kinase [Chloroflexota bacterium]